MLRSIVTLAAAATLIAGAAQAQCRPSITDAVLTTFGPVIADSGGDETVYQVTGLRMFGRTVPHVLVERDYGGPISALRYRLGQEVRESGERVDADLEARFRAAYQGKTSCAILTCTGHPDVGYELGDLQLTKLQDEELYVDEDWTGPAVSTLMAQDEGAVYLSCEYKAFE